MNRFEPKVFKNLIKTIYSKAYFEKEYAKLWFTYMNSVTRLLYKFNQRRVFYILAMILIFALLSLYVSSDIHRYLHVYITDKRVENVQQVLLALGGSFVGATAIIFSLVMFAMQVNVERMPYGLFHKFNSDKKLLLSFLLSFIFASSIMALSIVDVSKYIIYIILISFWLSFSILLLFLFAYQRALSLVSPTKQLLFIHQDLDKYLKRCSKKAIKAAPLFSIEQNASAGLETSHDMTRLLYFKNAPGWDTPVINAIKHCISYSRRYAELRDYETCGQALAAVLMINKEYISTKGKTFFSDFALMSSAESHDLVFNATLEELRQSVQAGINSQDEVLVEANFRIMVSLIGLYYQIDYSYDYAQKTHAHLAVAYLGSAVEQALPNMQADVLMEGARQLGKAGISVVNYQDVIQLPIITNKLALLAISSRANNRFTPVTTTCVEQLAHITLHLIIHSEQSILSPVENIRVNLMTVISQVLPQNEGQFSKDHSHMLGGYYSSTTLNSLQVKLGDVVNELLTLDAADEVGMRVVGNLVEWSDQIYYHEKEVFLESLKFRTSFSFDSIHWITGVSELLIVAANSACCSDHNKQSLIRNSQWLINVLSWVPDDSEIIQFIENYKFTETIFELALKARSRGCNEIFDDCKKILIGWTLKAGKYQSGWATLERGLQGIVALNMLDGIDNTQIIKKVEAAINKGAFEIDFRHRTANDLRNTEFNHSSGIIERVLGQQDRILIMDRLNELADVLAGGAE